MIKIIKQFDVGKYTLIGMDSQTPNTKFNKAIIDGKEYELEIAYDLKNSIGIVGKGNFVGKEIIFV